MPIRWNMTTEKPPDVSVRGWRDMLKGAWEAVGRWWDAVVKPRHFEPDAHDRYNYRPRSPGTIKRKLKLAAYYGVEPNRDLVWTGDTRRDVMRPQIPRPFPTRVTIDMVTRDYIQMRPKNMARPNMGEELTTLSADERAEAEQIWCATFERLYTEYRA